MFWQLCKSELLIIQGTHGNDGFTISTTMGEIGAGPSDLLNEAELVAVAEEKETHAFEIDPSKVPCF